MISTNIPKFRFKNVGPVKAAELALGDLTLIAGRNNTGKTYIAYALYGFLKLWQTSWVLQFLLRNGKMDSPLQPRDIQDYARRVLNEGRAQYAIDEKTLSEGRRILMQEICNYFSNQELPGIFGTKSTAFENASFEAVLSDRYPKTPVSIQQGIYVLQYDGKNIDVTRETGAVKEKARGFLIPVAEDFYALFSAFLFPELCFEPFVITSERFGISLFYKELDLAKNRLVNALQKWEEDKSQFPFSLIGESIGRYALPIKDHIAYTRGIGNFKEEKSDIYEKKLFNDVRDMMKGYFKSEDDAIFFRSTARREGKFRLPLYLASASARGLSDLYFFLRHVAQGNHLLIIDEPESHLDTANQRLLARLLARIVRAGIKVFITTHSDYLIKEFNNLVMLCEADDWPEVTQRFGYTKDDALSPASIRAYMTGKNGLRQCVVDAYGIDMPVFDETIDDINRVASDLSSRLIANGIFMENESDAEISA